MAHRPWSLLLAFVFACGAAFWIGRSGAPKAERKAVAAVTREGATAGPTCSLTPSELATQRDKLIPGLFDRAESAEGIENGIRFRFTPQPNLIVELATLIETENACCGFLAFQLLTEGEEGPITLVVTGPPGTAEMLRKL
jgi:hypothetical protein